MKKWLLFLAIAIAASLWFFLFNTTRAPSAVSRSPIALTRQAGMSPVASALPKKRSATVDKEVSGRTPLEVTLNYLEKYKAEWQIQQHHDLIPEVYRSPLGSRVKYSVQQ